eukprot:m.152871 g.152871  ORF g.152871 m.152871 type:complete len:147 (-) comp9780_c1_seq7:1362-1802(-)
MRAGRAVQESSALRVSSNMEIDTWRVKNVRGACEHEEQHSRKQRIRGAEVRARDRERKTGSEQLSHARPVKMHSKCAHRKSNLEEASTALASRERADLLSIGARWATIAASVPPTEIMAVVRIERASGHAPLSHNPHSLTDFVSGC